MSGFLNVGGWPSGKAAAFEAAIRGFESLTPSQTFHKIEMKNLLAVMLLSVFFISACNTEPTIAPVEETEVETVVEATEDSEAVVETDAEYEIRFDAAGSSLFYGETKLVDFEATDSLRTNEQLIGEVFKGDENDIVFVLNGAGCGGCVAFRDEYYVVDKSDLSVETVEFYGPEEINIFKIGAPMNAIYEPSMRKMAYVYSEGSLYEYDDSYFEEVWSYNFDKNEWRLVQRIDKGKTLMCESMGFSIDPKKIRYWKEALLVSPASIEEEMSCGA